MSYGGQSNVPWQRNVMQGHPQGGYNQGSQMYMQNAQQNNIAAFGHGSGSGAGMFPGGGGNSVSYPQSRSGLNPVAFQQGGSNPTHYNSIGTVTKMSNDCGLVNNEVFFYRNVCKGKEPELGDRVMFEASFSNSGQFKWNATRVQLMQQQQPLMTSNKNSYASVAPPNEYQRTQVRRHSPKRSPARGKPDRDNRNRERLYRSRDRDEEEHERKRRREDRSRDQGAAAIASNRASVGVNEGRTGNARIEKERPRAESRKKDREIAVREREDRVREKQRERTRELEVNRAAPIVRRGRATKHYMVKMPKTLLAIKTADVQELRQRYNSLYIPSDFFHANIKWSDTFTPDNPLSLRRPCQFHIMHEIVECPIEQNKDLLEPPDANYLYSAKVMLMSLPPIAEMYKKCFENANDDDDHHALHPTRLINFLVGVKGRVGSMAIGGPWSPSLDGENPDKDPSVLIRTAIRTCKALIGVDLSNCTQWYRFVELYYHRTEYKNMEKDGPPRVETVVIYLPDVHSCMPSMDEWQTLTQAYKNAVDNIIARREALVAAAAANSNDVDKDKTQDVEMADNSTTLTDDHADVEKLADNDEIGSENNDEDAVDLQEEEEQEETMDVSTASVDLTEADVVGGKGDGADDNGGAEDVELAENTTAAVDENDESIPEPTHYSLLDLKVMKLQEIRDELLARNLPDTGVRNVVMARLAKALNNEKSVESKNKNKTQKPDAAKKSNEEIFKVDSKVAPEKSSDIESAIKNEKRCAKVNNGDVKSSKSPDGKKKATNSKNENTSTKEDNVDWANIIDFELSDIVILDEYDSSKNIDESNMKEMSEKEKNRLIRHHTLPSSPHIVVHPNKAAKEGKFDCAIMSLSALLDYHPDDSKERFFEVSLFAEVFNEMLMRDFGFNIYKEFYLYGESAKANNVCEIADIKSEGDDNKIGNADEIKKDFKGNDNEKDKSSQKDSKSSNEDKSGREQLHNDDLQSIKAESRKRKISTSNSLANGNEHKLAASGKKMVVVKPQLLLSFVYFDTSYCGYIHDKHLEDLFYVLGLNLSRSQIKNVLAKLGNLASGQNIFYRKLTDKEVPLESTPAIEDVDDLAFDEHKRIAAGNNQYEVVFGRKTVHSYISAIEGDGNNEEGLINCNGTIVHVGKLLNQINRTEKNYSDLEKLYNDLIKQHNDLQKEHNKTCTKIKDLQSEIKSVSRKLTDANQDFYSLNRKYRDQHSTLSYIYTKVEPYFSKEKDKEKDKKSEGPHDKEKNGKEKENDMPKDKECGKEKSKDEKEKGIKKEDNKNIEKVKDDNEKQAVNESKDEEENGKIKDDKEKDPEKVADDIDNVKEKVKDKEKDSSISDKENPKNYIQKEKTMENKEKQTAKVDKVKQTPQKAVAQKPKPQTPVVKKQTGGTKPTNKVVKKSENIGTAKK